MRWLAAASLHPPGQVFTRYRALVAAEKHEAAIDRFVERRLAEKRARE